jgi:hypothetical protein
MPCGCLDLAVTTLPTPPESPGNHDYHDAHLPPVQEAMKWQDAEIRKIVEKMCEDSGIEILSWGWMMGASGAEKIGRPADSKA